MNDPEYTIAWPDGDGIGGLPERLWVRDDLSSVEDYTVGDLAGGLTSLGFITATLRRTARFWIAVAILGLLVGCGFYVRYPPSYQASASVLLTAGPYENITTAEDNNAAIAETRAVAGLALRKLGLRESAESFLGSYTATPITDRVLTITANAPSSEQAVLRANAVAAAFLQFRASEMQAQQTLVFASLNQQISQAQQNLDSLNAQISQLSAQSASSTGRSKLKSLDARRTAANYLIYSLEQAVLDGKTGTEPATAAAVHGSVMLDAAAPLTHSRLKPLLRDGGIGLVGGLALGMIIVVIQGLVSNRLRRRDDVARALGGPVRLSVGSGGSAWPKRWLASLPWLRSLPWLAGLPREAAGRDADVQRIAAHLGQFAPGNSQDLAALAVVPVDDLEVPALSVVSLALARAGQGERVVVADLCGGAPAARLLGAGDPGVAAVRTRGSSLVVAVPPGDEPLPVGPLGQRSVQAQRSSFTEAVAAACTSADLVLTLITLDPALGGDHLATWTADAVAVVTAGRSSWESIHSTGELVRLSGTRLVSAVLVGADKTDHSVGSTRAPEAVLGSGLHDG